MSEPMLLPFNTAKAKQPFFKQILAGHRPMFMQKEKKKPQEGNRKVNAIWQH